MGERFYFFIPPFLIKLYGKHGGIGKEVGLDWINIFQFAICYIGLGAIVDDDDDG